MRVRVWTIGLFIVLGVGFTVAILFMIGSEQELFGQHVEVFAEFSNLDGVGKGTKVQVSGLAAGEVKEVFIPGSPGAKFRLKLQLERKAMGMVRSDSLVTIKTAGVVGDQFLSIKKGSEGAPEAISGTTLPSKEPFDLSALTDKATVLLDDVKGSLDDLHGRLDSTLGTVQKTVNHVDQTVLAISPHFRDVSANIDQMVTDLSNGKGSAGLLLRDDATREQLRSTLANVHQTSVDAQHAVAGIDATVSDFQSRNLVGNLQHSLDNVQSMTSQLQAAVNDALAKDSMGQSGSENVRETLSNLNLDTANLAEDTEALKHNFLLRGFFKKRGLYSLDELTPPAYTAALKHEKGNDPRIWINSSVFEAGNDMGPEQLSKSGRAQIDLMVSPSVGGLPGAVIVVEGYSPAGEPAEQFVISRRRADLVRRYLELRYHLRRSDIGIVPLLAPPEGSAKTVWNGAAIVLLHQGGGK